jgi:hypothetical protein
LYEIEIHQKVIEKVIKNFKIKTDMNQDDIKRNTREKEVTTLQHLRPEKVEKK